MVLNDEQPFRAITDTALAPLALLDTDGLITYVNPAFVHALGYWPYDLVGRPLTSLTHPDDADAVDALVRRVCRQPGADAKVEFRIRHQNGAWRTLEMVLRNAVRNAVVGGVVAHARDVTERRRSEEAREAAELRYRTLFEHVPWACALCDEDGTVWVVNRAFERLTGLPRGDIEGVMRWKDLVQREEGARAEAGIRAGATTVDLELSGAAKAGGRVHASVVPVSGTEHQLWSFVPAPTSGAPAPPPEGDEAGALRAVAELTATIAHEFNNLLTVILVNAELLANELPPELAEARARVEDLHAAAGRGALLVRNLRSLRAQEASTRAPQDLVRVVADLDSRLRRRLPPDVMLDLALDRATPAIIADEAALEQIVVTLVVDAADHTPAGGTVTVVVRPVHAAAGGPLAELLPPGSFVVLAVHGGGAAPEEGPELAVVRGLVREHGAHLQIEAAPDDGATARVFFPVAGERAAAPHPLETAPDLRGGDETILLVEDEEDLRHAGRRILEKYGYRVVEASDGAEALNLLRGGGAVDLVVSDFMMPRLDGWELYQVLRREFPTVKFLLTTAYAPALVTRLASEPATVVLEKPWTMAGLIRLVRAVLDAATT